MKLSVVIPAHNEEGCVRETIDRLRAALAAAEIPHEILVVNDHSTDGTERILCELAAEDPSVRWVANDKPNGFGYALQTGLEQFSGDAVCIVMADASDDPDDVASYYRKLEAGYECVFGSRFTRQSRVVDYPRHKLIVNRMANWFINVLFHLGFNDTTNAFKAYRREVIQGVQPILSSHFNITVELPLKAITRGYTYATVPINWYNRTTGVSKLKIKEMGSRYLFIVLYVWLERMLSRGDYQRRHELLAAPQPRSAYALTAAVAAEPSGVVQVAAGAPHDQALPEARGGGTALLDAPDGERVPTSEVREPEAPPPTQEAVPTISATRKLWNLIRWGVFLVPLALLGYITWAIWTRTPQVPFWDEWESVVLVQRVMHGTATLGDFARFHNEHRIIVPQLVDVGLILITHWNRQIEMTFHLALAIGEAALLLAALHRIVRSTTLTLLLVVPLSLLLFSFAQYSNWLWAWQSTFIMTTLGAAICVWALSSEQLTWRMLALGIGGAVLAALSSLGGTAAFIAFLPAVTRGGARKTPVWIAVALAVLIPYFQGFPHSVPVKLSLALVQFVLAFLGGPLGTPNASRSEWAGVISLGLVLANLALYLYVHRSIRGVEAWLGLGLFALANAAMTALGRLSAFGVTDAIVSRYQVFAVLWWVMLVALIAANTRGALASFASSSIPKREMLFQRLLAGINGVTIVGVCMVLVLVSRLSVHNMKDYQYGLVLNQACVVNYAFAPPSCLEQYYFLPSGVQTRASFLEQAHLGLFSGDTSTLKRPAPNPLTHPLTPYFNKYTGDQWATIRYDLDKRDGYVALAPLGYLYAQQQPGTYALYGCLTTNGEHFLATQPNCAGQQMLETEGWLYAAPPAGLASAALYSCVSGDGRVVVTDTSCGKQTPQGLLGYILTSP